MRHTSKNTNEKEEKIKNGREVFPKKFSLPSQSPNGFNFRTVRFFKPEGLAVPLAAHFVPIVIATIALTIVEVVPARIVIISV